VIRGDGAVRLEQGEQLAGLVAHELLRAAGLDDLALADLIHAAAFFNWANRLMLSLGEPTEKAPTIEARPHQA